MKKASARIIALSIGTSVGISIAWFLVSTLRSDSPNVIGLHDRSEKVDELSDFLIRGGAVGAGASRGPLGHELLTEPVADRVFGFRRSGLQYDPLTYFRRPGFFEAKQVWAEHPDGSFMMRTNCLGLREDEELSREHPALRILVTGDSHTDGVCNNSESYSNRLEEFLTESRPGKRVEVLNAGVGAYSFYNYLGAFDRYLEFRMDAFIVGVYGGNDFYELLAPYSFFKGEKRPGWKKGTWESIERAMAIDKPALAQGFVAYTWFRENPDYVDRTREIAVSVTLELARRCKQAKVRLIVAYIPPVYDVQWEVGAEKWSRLCEILQLNESDIRVTDRQADEYLEALAAQDVTVLDLRPAFRAATEALYWVTDHHINLAGHECVARQLQPVVEQVFAR